MYLVTSTTQFVLQPSRPSLYRNWPFRPSLYCNRPSLPIVHGLPVAPNSTSASSCNCSTATASRPRRGWPHARCRSRTAPVVPATRSTRSSRNTKTLTAPSTRKRRRSPRCRRSPTSSSTTTTMTAMASSRRDSRCSTGEQSSNRSMILRITIRMYMPVSRPGIFPSENYLRKTLYKTACTHSYYFA